LIIYLNNHIDFFVFRLARKERKNNNNNTKRFVQEMNVVLEHLI